MTVQGKIGTSFEVGSYVKFSILITFQIHPWETLRITFFTLQAVYRYKSYVTNGIWFRDSKEESQKESNEGGRRVGKTDCLPRHKKKSPFEC
jgi:hypothetical protein